jgi:hypothetical protein
MTSALFFNAFKAGFCCGYGKYVLEGVTSRCSYSAFQPMKDEVLQGVNNAFAEKYDMRGMVHLVEGNCYPLAGSSGSSLFRTYQKTVYVDKVLREIDQAAAIWSIRHQVCLLKTNSHFLSRIATLVPAIMLFSTCSFPLALCGTLATHILISPKLQYQQNLIAARLANESASEQELKGSVRLVKAEKDALSEYAQNTKMSKFEKYIYGFDNSKEEQLQEAIGALKSRFQCTEASINQILQDKRINVLKNRILFLLQN